MVRSIHMATIGAVMSVVIAGPAHADPVKCQKAIVTQMLKLKKAHLKAHEKCLDAKNDGKFQGSCPDAVANLKIQKVSAKVDTVLATNCTMLDLATLDFPNDCVFEAGVSGVEATCAALPVTTPTEFSACLKCWKRAELSEFVALLYASHALEVCGSDLSETSPVCSDLDCTTPLPDQGDLSGGAVDCQKAIGKAGIKYLVSREKILEKCALAGGTRASCLGDALIQVLFQKAETKKVNTIKNKCGNRDPVPSPPFCCKTGNPNQCVAAADRNDCETNLAGTVQEGKTCNAGTCDPVGGGNQTITWWGFCPEANTCPGAALSSLDDLIDCVDSSADAIADELLCLQFPRNAHADWPCPTDGP